MVDFGTLLSGLTFASSVQERRENERLREAIANQGEMPDEAPPDLQVQENIKDTLEEIRKNAEKNEPSIGDKDAYSSSTFDLDPGETAVITVEPQDGFNLRVKEVHIDRRTDHDYTINVGGEVTSVSHRSKYVSPKRVTQSDRVQAEVTNNSSDTSTLDFEMEAWAEQG